MKKETEHQVPTYTATSPAQTQMLCRAGHRCVTVGCSDNLCLLTQRPTEDGSGHMNSDTLLDDCAWSTRGMVKLRR